MLHLTNIDHAGINVTNLEQSAKWYHTVLGFELVHQFTHTWMVGRGNMRLGLFERPEAKPLDNLDNTIAITHIAFLTTAEGLLEAQEFMTDQQIPFQPLEDTGIAHSLFINDPDGNQIELTTYYAPGFNGRKI